ncbi:MAG: KilA-N domain-containing protein [Epsilonproteobacteria bacterium]|nr:KilA-N domain-containing protein [Campylobacterota bacterium]
MKNKIIVQEQLISIIEDDYISLTDMVKNIENGLVLIEKWLRNKNTIEFLGIWEEIYNTNFNSPEFEGIKNEAGYNRFSLSVKMWINKTNAIGILAKAGRYGGTYAHKDIAFEFASWISPKFKLYLIKEFQRLKNDEIEKQKIGWDIKRTLVKMNYHIHTDAIKNNLIPPNIAKSKIQFIYATEADLLNVALFGLTAKQWCEQNPKLEGNMRDYATAEQLVVLANLESLNAQFIKQNLPFEERLISLNKIAIEQLELLLKYETKRIGERR